MAVKFQLKDNGLLRAYSDSGKFLTELPSGDDIYTEAINSGVYISENEGYFDNGNTYVENEKDIPVEIGEENGRT